MLVIGTGGLARDIAGNISKETDQHKYVFYNDMPGKGENTFLGRYRVLCSQNEAREYFEKEEPFFLSAVANPLMRMRLNEKFKKMGGSLGGFLFPEPKYISDFVKIGEGCIIQFNVIISSNTIIEEGVFINCDSIIGHDVFIGKYCSFAPGVRILGNVTIGAFSYIGCNVVIMPGVKIGEKVRIAAGKIIDKDIPDNSKIL